MITSVVLSTSHWSVNHNRDLNSALNFCLLFDAHLFPLFPLATVSEVAAKGNFKEIAKFDRLWGGYRVSIYFLNRQDILKNSINFEYISF